MARVQLVMPDSDRDRYVYQAQRQGITFSAWLRAAAEERLAKQQQVKRFESAEDLREFFRKCCVQAGAGREPDWEESKRTIDKLPSWAHDHDTWPS